MNQQNAQGNELNNNHKNIQNIATNTNLNSRHNNVCKQHNSDNNELYKNTQNNFENNLNGTQQNAQGNELTNINVTTKNLNNNQTNNLNNQNDIRTAFKQQKAQSIEVKQNDKNTKYNPNKYQSETPIQATLNQIGANFTPQQINKITNYDNQNVSQSNITQISASPASTHSSSHSHYSHTNLHHSHLSHSHIQSQKPLLTNVEQNKRNIRNVTKYSFKKDIETYVFNKNRIQFHHIMDFKDPSERYSWNYNSSIDLPLNYIPESMF